MGGINGKFFIFLFLKPCLKGAKQTKGKTSMKYISYEAGSVLVMSEHQNAGEKLSGQLSNSQKNVRYSSDSTLSYNVTHME